MLPSLKMALCNFTSNHLFKCPPFILQMTLVEAEKFLTLAQGHAMTHSENFKASVLAALYPKKARLSAVLNQVTVKSYDCTELFFTFDEQFSF